MPVKDPQPPRAHDALARALAEHRDANFQQAVELYAEVLAADPTQAEVRCYLGAAEQDRGERTAALDGFRKAVDPDPKNSSYQAKLAATLHTAGRLEDRVEAYRTALKGDPADHTCRNNLAGAFSALGRTVWLMLRYAPDWRWAANGDATPWYPTTRLFWQPVPGDWGGVVDSIAQALDEFE